uniref:Uncharacterized protein n=1 Tax=Cannabis sativa TaxID=3483 RepID=A0A803R378_CANSA
MGVVTRIKYFSDLDPSLARYCVIQKLINLLEWISLGLISIINKGLIAFQCYFSFSEKFQSCFSIQLLICLN